MNQVRMIIALFLSLSCGAQAMRLQYPNIAEAGDVAAVQAFLDVGVPVDQVDGLGDTALIWSALGGHESVVRLLLANSASVNYADWVGNTALKVAVGGGHESIVRILLAHGASVNQVGLSGNTALILAAGRGYESIVRLLLAHGASVNHADRDGDTALTWAAEQGGYSIVRLLLENGALVNHADKNGNTALMKAAYYNYASGCTALINRMLKIPSDMQRPKLYTFLMCMKRFGFDSVVRNAFKPHLLDVIEQENRENPEDAVALREIEKIKSVCMKQKLVAMYWPEKSL